MALMEGEKEGEIVVTHVANSTLVGSVQRFRKSRVLIGRRTANDLRFDKNRDLTVSGFHAELYHAKGKLFVQDVGSRNGTFVNDELLDAPCAVEPEDIITLGVPGAKIQAKWQPLEYEGIATVEGHSTAVSKKSVGMSTLGHIIETVVHKERSRSRRGLLTVVLLVLCVGIASLGVILYRESGLREEQQKFAATSKVQQQELDETKQALQDTEKQLRERISATEQAIVEVRARNEARVQDRLQQLETQLEKIEGKITKEDANVSRLMVEIQERDAVLRRLQNVRDVSATQREQLTDENNRQIQSLRAELTKTQERLRENETRKATWSDHVEKYNESVFLCLGFTSDVGQGIGTGFVVRDDGLLATNAHVVKVLQKYNQHFAIQNKTGRVFPILKMVAHPKHVDIQSPDVGLIQIDPLGETMLPFVLADDDTLALLRIGTQLGTLGFPGELTPAYLRDFRPEKKRVRTIQATFKDGWVGRITNYRLENDDERFSRYIQHSASLSPGTSGSPMFNLEGKVIAINTGTLQIESDLTVEVDGKKTTTKVTNPSASEIAFAVRSDELRELFDEFPSDKSGP